MGGLNARACEAKSFLVPHTHVQYTHSSLNSAWSYYDSCSECLLYSATVLGREYQREKGKTEVRNDKVAFLTIWQG